MALYRIVDNVDYRTVKCHLHHMLMRTDKQKSETPKSANKESIRIEMQRE